MNKNLEAFANHLEQIFTPSKTAEEAQLEKQTSYSIEIAKNIKTNPSTRETTDTAHGEYNFRFEQSGR